MAKTDESDKTTAPEGDVGVETGEGPQTAMEAALTKANIATADDVPEAPEKKKATKKKKPAVTVVEKELTPDNAETLRKAQALNQAILKLLPKLDTFLQGESEAMHKAVVDGWVALRRGAMEELNESNSGSKYDELFALWEDLLDAVSAISVKRVAGMVESAIHGTLRPVERETLQNDIAGRMRSADRAMKLARRSGKGLRKAEKALIASRFDRHIALCGCGEKIWKPGELYCPKCSRNGGALLSFVVHNTDTLLAMDIHTLQKTLEAALFAGEDTTKAILKIAKAVMVLDAEDVASLMTSYHERSCQSRGKDAYLVPDDFEEAAEGRLADEVNTRVASAIAEYEAAVVAYEAAREDMKTVLGVANPAERLAAEVECNKTREELASASKAIAPAAWAAAHNRCDPYVGSCTKCEGKMFNPRFELCPFCGKLAKCLQKAQRVPTKGHPEAERRKTRLMARVGNVKYGDWGALNEIYALLFPPHQNNRRGQRPQQDRRGRRGR